MLLHKISKLNRLGRIQFISSKSSTKTSDTFGINDVTSKDLKGTYEMNEEDKQTIDQKYSYINNLNKLDNLEEEVRYPHGTIRLDKFNKPKYHGQFDEDNEKIRFDIDSIEKIVNNQPDESGESIKSTAQLDAAQEFNKNVQLSSLIRSLTKKVVQNEEKIEKPEEDSISSKDLISSEEEQSPKRTYNRPFRPKTDISNVDIYDYESIKKVYSKHKLVFNFNLLNKAIDFKFANQWANWIERDMECAKSPLALLFQEQKMAINPMLKETYEMRTGKVEQNSFEEQNDYSPLKKLSDIEEELKECREEELARMNGLNQNQATNREMNLKALFEQQFKQPEVSNEENLSDPESDDPSIVQKKQIRVSEMTALDYLRKIKNKEVDVHTPKLKQVIDEKKDSKDNSTFKRDKLEFDSKGFKNYRNQVFNLYALNNTDRALFLESEIIFNNLGIVAVNKPYGLVCPGDQDNSFEDKRKKSVELTSFLRDFAYLIAMQDKKEGTENTFEDLNNPILYPIYKLDRHCTGVYILAKNKETTKIVHALFKEREVKLFYDAITKNIPKLDKASIDIPIEQDLKDIKYGRMMLRPDLEGDYKVLVKASRRADKAITNYKVLKTSKSAAYLELNPLTSVRHQLRAHLGFGLRTPILGDHLYDNTFKIDYQKLPLDMLLNLNVRPTKTMHIPMHLHCKLIILGRFGRNNRDIFLKADLPTFFRENLKSLKLN